MTETTYRPGPYIGAAHVAARAAFYASTARDNDGRQLDAHEAAERVLRSAPAGSYLFEYRHAEGAVIARAVRRDAEHAPPLPTWRDAA